MLWLNLDMYESVREDSEQIEYYYNQFNTKKIFWH